MQCGEAWLVPEIKHALDEDQVIFGDEEIGETMQHVFGYPAGNRFSPGLTCADIPELPLCFKLQLEACRAIFCCFFALMHSLN